MVSGLRVRMVEEFVRTGAAKDEETAEELANDIGAAMQVLHAIIDAKKQDERGIYEFAAVVMAASYRGNMTTVGRAIVDACGKAFNDEIEARMVAAQAAERGQAS